ncbi:MAG: SusC/RagA family TonB-linked outer membrane protein, partial [Odoribacter sp.]|nr:SusC/RagA family TonB-linked outer membrane protein [Odoribacter sp.]
SYVQGERGDSWIGSSGVRSEALRKMPNQSPYYIDAQTGERTSEYFTPQENFIGSFTGSANFNPVAMVNDSYSNTTSREGKILFRLYYQIIPDLSYTGYVSLNLKTTKNKKFLPVSAAGVMWTDPYFNMSSDLLSDGQSLVTENKLTYIKKFNNQHNLVATALIRTRESNGSSYSSHTYGNAAPGLSDPTSSGSVRDGGSGDSKSRSMSAIGNAHYTLLNRYMFNGTINLEGNSSMGGSNRYGIFYAVGAGWNIHEESFLREKEWLDMAKIHYSYGKSGKSAGGTAPYLGAFGVIGNYMGMNGVGPVSIQLDNLKWQSSYEHNIGLDLNLWESKLTFTFDWYTKKTVDLLQANYGIPTSTGYSSIKYYNSGKMTNEGLEFRANYEVFKNKDWRVTVNANISRNVNKVKELPANMVEEGYSFSNGNYATRVIAGDPVGSFYGYRYQGVYQNKEDTYARDANGNIMTNISGDRIIMKNNDVVVYPGDAKYADINNDGVINEYDIVYLGNGMPFLTSGGGFSIKYKDLTLTTSFHGHFGQKVINRARMNAESMYSKGNQSTAVLRRWRAEGDDTDIPRALYNYGYNYLGSDRFVEKCSYLRLKTLTLNYNIPKKVLQGIGIQRVSVFFTGYNLLTWTNYTGQDPEVSLPGSARALVTDSSQTPVARRYALGLNINF